MNDYIKHILAGLLIACVVGLPCYLDSGNLFVGLWASLTAGAIAGGVKEWCDNTYEWVWSWRDLGFTCLGAAIDVRYIVPTVLCGCAGREHWKWRVEVGLIISVYTALLFQQH